MVSSWIMFQAGVRVLALCWPGSEFPMVPTAAGVESIVREPQILWSRLERIDVPQMVCALGGTRPKLIIATMPQCAYCDRLKTETLSGPEVERLLKQFDVQVVDKSQNPELLKGYSIAIYPSIVVLSAEGDPLGKISGFVPQDKLCRTLRNVLKSGT